jgi:hypothetical protein
MRIDATNLTGQGATNIHAAHNPGEIAPTFTVEFRPHAARASAFTTHRAWTPPRDVTFTIGDASWTCQPGDAPKRIGNGVAYSVTYIPTPLYVLQHGSYDKRLVWLSCPDWQYALYMESVDEDETVVHHTPSDVYTSTGWTANAIFEKIGSYVGFTIDAQFPTLHVAQPSLVLEREQTFLPFLQGLLPSGFDYTWDWQRDGVVVGLAEPHSGEFTIPPGAHAIDLDTPAKHDYTKVVLTGAPYKLNSGLTLSTSAHTRSLQINPGGHALETVEETLPEEVQSFPDGNQTVTPSRTMSYGPDGQVFAVREESQTIHGPIYTSQGVYSHTGLVRRVETEHTFEHDDALTYQEPRLTETVAATSGYVTVITPTETGVSNGHVYHLLDDLRVVTRAEFLTLDPPPTVLASGVTSWVDNYEIVTDTKAFVQETEASLSWPEGIERTSERTVRRLTYFVKDRFYDCTDSPETILQQIAQRLQTDDTPTVGTVLAAVRTVDLASRKVVVQTKNAYEFEETVSRIDSSAGRVQNSRNVTPINGTPPSQPAAYRSEPLKAVLDRTDGGAVSRIGGTTIEYCVAAQIPTANPTDFEAWGAKRFKDIMSPPELLTFSTHAYLLPQGYRIAGGTVIGWSASQQGAVFAASMKVK